MFSADLRRFEDLKSVGGKVGQLSVIRRSCLGEPSVKSPAQEKAVFMSLYFRRRCSQPSFSVRISFLPRKESKHLLLLQRSGLQEHNENPKKSRTSKTRKAVKWD